MGFFSWITQNTNESIPNEHSTKCTFNVALLTDKGILSEEDSYNGYGIFGGYDYYEVVAEMNPELVEHLEKVGRVKYGALRWELNNNRTIGIVIDSDEEDFDEIKKGYDIKYPNLIRYECGEGKDWKWINEKPKDCPAQGFFYN